MKRRACAYLILSAALAAPSSAWALNDEVPEGAPNNAYNVAIVNETSADLKFDLRPKGGTWTEYAIASNTKGIYRCDGCAGRFEFRIVTAGVQVEYSLVASGPYAIRINTDRNIYDLYAPH